MKVLLFLLISAVETFAGDLSSSDPVAVVAYLPEWRYEGANWETISEHTTHLLLFSLEMTSKGKIVAMDRFPRKELYKEAREATRKHGTALMICFGGNGRSQGFSGMTRKSKHRKHFVKELVELIEKYDLDGVDYNWEYPGYRFGQGYLSDSEVQADYEGLSKLLFATREIFTQRGWTNKVITLAYYPDGRQEQLLRDHGIAEQADLLHMMSYDQGGAHHSSLQYGKRSADQGKHILSARQLTMGVPFYGRHSQSGEWTTYEDLVQKHWPLDFNQDAVDAPQGATIGFNGVQTMSLKPGHDMGSRSRLSPCACGSWVNDTCEDVPSRQCFIAVSYFQYFGTGETTADEDGRLAG